MSTFDAALHPRGQAGNAGQFAAKQNTAPAGALLDDAVGPEALTGNWVSDGAADEPGVTEITREEFAGGNVVDAAQLKAGDTLLWRSMTDAGERYFSEEIKFAQSGLDGNYKRVVLVETKRRPGGDRTIRFRATQQVGIMAEPERSVEYPSLRGGHLPADLQIVVESSDAHGSTVVLRPAGGEQMLDRFRVAGSFAPGAVPLLEAGRDVQEQVAHRFIPLAGLSLDEQLAREPLSHGGRAWND